MLSLIGNMEDKKRIAARGKKWHEENRERHLASSKKWKVENREHDLAYKKKYREEHKEYTAICKRKWDKNNPELRLKHNLKYFSKIGKPLNKSVYETKYALDSWSKTVRKIHGNHCSVCGSTKGLNVHHIFSKKKFPKMAFMVNNGIPLCKIHHLEIHRLNN